MFSVNYEPNVLHVALRDLEDRVFSQKEIEYGARDSNGLVYNPELVFSKIHRTSERMYADLFKKGQQVVVVPLETEQSPRELVKTLNSEFGVDYCMAVDGITAKFTATPEQAKRIIDELTNNPKKYFVSPEK